MPHKYDLFLQLAQGNHHPLIQNKTYFENQLIQEKVLFKKNNKAILLQTPKSQKLFSILMFCLNNDLDYTFYTKKTTIQYLADFFGNKKTVISINTQTQIRKRLHKDRFLVYFSQKPLDFIILRHTFFKELLAYFTKEYKKIALPTRKIEHKLKHTKLRKENPEISTFIHTSLQLEGNLLTLRQTQQILQNQIIEKGVNLKDILETTNYKQAIEQIKGVQELSLDTIYHIHRVVIQHEKYAGLIRKEAVHIGGNPQFRILEYVKIEEELQKLCIELNNHTKKSASELCERAAYIHNQFQFIHPFLDGNSRTTRLIIQWYFNKHNVAFDIPISCTTLYIEQTKGYTSRDDKKLAQIFKLILIQLEKRD